MIDAKQAARLFLPVCLLMFLLTGCLSTHAPEEVYLRLGLGPTQICPESQSDNEDFRPSVTIKDVKSLPGLNRQSVMLSKGNSLYPSTVWYWEGTPAEVFSQVLQVGLSCSPEFRIIPRYNPRIDHDAVISGEVLAFEVELGASPAFSLGAKFELWTKRGREFLASKTFTAKRPMNAIDTGNITAAANAALDDLLEQVRTWLDNEAVNIPVE